MKNGMEKRLAAIEEAMPKVLGAVHRFFAWSSWNRDTILDDYGRDKIGPNDDVQFFIWRDDQVPEPYDYDQAVSKL